MNYRAIISLALTLGLTIPLLMLVARGRFVLAGFLIAAMFGIMVFRRLDIWWLLVVATLAWGIPLPIHNISVQLLSRLAVGALGLIIYAMTHGGSTRLGLRSPPRRATLVFCLVVLVTAVARGWGLRVLGSTMWGGMSYVVLLGGIMVFLCSPQVVVSERALWRAILVMFILGVFSVVWGIAGRILPGLGFTTGGMEAEVADIAQAERIQATQMPAIWSGMLALLLYDRKFKLSPLIILLGLISFVLMGLSGHRTVPVLLGLVVMIYLVVRRQYVPTPQYMQLVVALFLVIALTYAFVDQLPLTFQRALAWLPGIRVAYEAAMSAEGTTTWRIDLWRLLLPMIPDYFFLGRGLAFNIWQAYDVSLLASDIQRLQLFVETHNYHSGPLFLLVDFGIFGLLSAIVFMVGGIVRYGRALRAIPPSGYWFTAYGVMYVYFTASVIFFFAVIGGPQSLARLMIVASILEVILQSVRYEWRRGKEDGDRLSVNGDRSSVNGDRSSVGGDPLSVRRLPVFGNR